MTELGWQVIDPDGKVVASGPITLAEMSGELLNLIEGEQ